VPCAFERGVAGSQLGLGGQLAAVEEVHEPHSLGEAGLEGVAVFQAVELEVQAVRGLHLHWLVTAHNQIRTERIN
jgi:hypothetical protein